MRVFSAWVGVGLLVCATACGSGDAQSGSGGTAGKNATTTKQAFVTYSDYPGNVGVDGADAACNGDAFALPGRHFVALLSTSKQNAFDRIGAGPWYLGTDYLGTGAELAANELGTSFDRTPTGSAQAPGTYAWTGTSKGGASAPTNCNDWTSMDRAVTGTIGQIDFDAGRWIDALAATCDNYGNLYCFED